MKKKLFIIDGHALCYRAYYAFIRNPLVNSKGQNTSAIFGFARMLFKLVEDQKPDYLAVAFDPPGKSLRFKIFEEYKANRQKMPDDLRSQINEIKEMVRVLGIPSLELEDYEADDILGTVAKTFASPATEVVLVTGDKDAYQLLNENVTIYANKKGISEHEIYTHKNIVEKIGIPPERVIDYMALTGDTSDNIPGVKGVGGKTAQKLIGEYGTLEKIYDNIDSIKGRAATLLEEGRESAFLSRDLVTIRLDAPLEVSLEELIFNGYAEGAGEFFVENEMDSIVRDFFPSSLQLDEATPHFNREARRYVTIETVEELKEVLASLEEAKVFAFDTETDSVKPMEAELVGMSFSIEENQGWFLPLISRGLFGGGTIDREEALSLVTPLLQNEEIKKIGQNIKYDYLVLKKSGIELRGIAFDTMVASYLLTPSDRRHNMDDLAEKYLNYKTITYKELVGTGKSAIPITEVPMDRLSEYAIEDTDITLRLHNKFKPMLQESELTKLYEEIELPLLGVLASMEYHGVGIDRRHFARMEEETARRLSEVEEQIYEDAGQTFNINSTRELATILFDKIGLKPVRKTKTGFSTDIKVLEALQGKHDIIDRLISYRTLSKLKSTYIDTLPKLINPETGRIHTSYNQTVAATGRLSSSDPNLQNIPIRDSFGRQIRRGFVPEKGYYLLAADYSQIELRLAAHFSQDENMIKAFAQGIDIHNMTAASVFSVPMEEITPEMRRQAKIINFATIYGVSPYGLSQQAEIGMKEAAGFIAKYFELYPGFKDYIERTTTFAREKGFVRTLLGRRRDVPEIDSKTSFRREGAERIAINTPIQGTSADMIKIAMIRIDEFLRKQSMKSKMIMQVHDELVLEVHEDEGETVESAVKELMENAMELKVPVVVDMGRGQNWDEAH